METVSDFLVEDLLDFPAGDDTIITDALFLHSPHPNNTTNNSTGSSTPVHSSNSSSLSELCFPYDDLEELEWLSNFVEESFSGSTQIHPDPLIKPAATIMVPAKARSKLSRVAPSDWSTRVLMVTGHGLGHVDSAHVPVPKKPVMRRREGPNSPEEEARRCLHCASEKTPQWRSGPMGPKTLCNACGVRYKSGRLVPEYRPASSPTFLATKHSNSHRKVIELRRQKEMHIQRHHQQQQQQQQQFFGHANGTMFGISGGDDYLIHGHLGAV